MNREEWYEYAESVGLTRDQRGAILGHCDRLGLTDRTERLAVLANLIGLDELETTADLTLGQAGRLINRLAHTAALGELLDDQGDDADAKQPTSGPTVAAGLMQLALVLWQVFGDGVPGNPGADAERGQR